ncbi:ABC transporter ATP-binding protein [Streptomyces sp. E5N298]|uniref:ABC transporter ATP-binding protein n=1 Tax=Streptomyces sp. E5N298 TaxID=1851983 RepID=UPI000EF625CC|nr:ABC transporter ATP-binding protein [Streptomyces sp. E5N298]
MLLDIDRLTVHLPGAARPLLADVSLRVAAGEVVGLVGESGSGKSTTAKAVLRVLPDDAAAHGRVTVAGTDVLTMTPAALREHRARRVAMIHQNPRSALNPVHRVGDFLVERLLRTGDHDRRTARAHAVELLDSVGLNDPARRLRQYPHEMSGGMLQRVVIAGALAAGPDLILADESTSALDVTTQAEILALLRDLGQRRETGMLFITHDLHLAAAYCDRVYVMYAGRIAEHRSARSLFDHARHPYTRGLLDCSPELGVSRPLRPIPGRPPSLADGSDGCPFAARCPQAESACEVWAPQATELPDGGEAACRRLPEAAAASAGATVRNIP